MRGHEPYTDPTGITLRVSHKNVGDINLGDVNCRDASPFFFNDYDKFFPWLTITTWTIHSRLSFGKAGNSQYDLNFLGTVRETVYLDDDRSWTGMDIMTLYLGAYVVTEGYNIAAVPMYELDLADESDAKIYLISLLVHDSRRIGLWLHDHPGLSLQSHNAGKILAQALISCEERVGKQWKKETVRLY
jgi:hypothetical protein